MNQVLNDLSIEVEVCTRPYRAIELLSGYNIDLVVLDWDDDKAASEIICKISQVGNAKSPTIVAVTNSSKISDATRAGAHLVVPEPVTPESGKTSMKMAYSRMIQDYRRYARIAVMQPVTVKKEHGSPFTITVTDISQGGIGLHTKERLKIEDVLQFLILLPNAERIITLEACVRWAKESGLAGAELRNVAPADLQVLHGWLRKRCRVKKPITH
jgi:response regulator RpfG family c-di-GMP phosphodiesterase